MSRNGFLAVLPIEANSAQIVAAIGADAQATLRRASNENAALPLHAPEGTGLHVWEGRIQGDDMDGEWRRATVEDLERFGMPLSEPAASDEGSAVLNSGPPPTGTRPEGPYCCKMREKFVIGVVATNESVPMPTELADHVLHWGKKILFATSFCPFCGTKIDHTQTLRVNPDAL